MLNSILSRWSNCNIDSQSKRKHRGPRIYTYKLKPIYENFDELINYMKPITLFKNKETIQLDNYNYQNILETYEQFQ